jgi:di/tricarboxylate transporter
VLGAVVALFVWNRFPPEIVALGAAIALYAAGVLDSHQVFAGFGTRSSRSSRACS